MITLLSRYGPWAMVAGASEGLGAEYARYLASLGFHLILIARRQAQLEAISEELTTKFGVQTQVKVLDLSDTDQLVTYLQNELPDVGLAIYNAAYSPLGYFTETSIKDLHMVTDVNVRSALLFTKVIVDRLKSRHRPGGIVLMSSLSGGQGTPRLATYAASKSFNTILAEGLWYELKDDDIDVIASVAGAIRTPGYASRSAQKDAPGTLDPEQVVKKTLRQLGKGPTVVPGWTNSLGTFVMKRLLPKSLAIKMMHNNTKSLQ